MDLLLSTGFRINTTEAKMETAHSVEEEGRENDASVGRKAEGKSTPVTL